MNRHTRVLGFVLAALAGGACRPPGSTGGPPSRLPALPAPMELADTTAPRAVEDPPVAIEPLSSRRVSINANDADVRSLLTAIGRATGYNVVVSSQVRARVSLSLTDVPVEEAVQAIIDIAGLAVIRPPTEPEALIVFMQEPVNINEASAEKIARRFDVSDSLARFIVESRLNRRNP